MDYFETLRGHQVPHHLGFHNCSLWAMPLATHRDVILLNSPPVSLTWDCITLPNMRCEVYFNIQDKSMFPLHFLHGLLLPLAATVPFCPTLWLSSIIYKVLFRLLEFPAPFFNKQMWCLTERKKQNYSAFPVYLLTIKSRTVRDIERKENSCHKEYDLFKNSFCWRVRRVTWRSSG